ncbi:cellulase family glycosylhydrolase [Conexibacter sp. SYSU D00693]|uniref:cellulase family glycosylhydrolase n=1 Tax=Conexibacter sp. SYSU D00693 TaxID=2812560 RepID=UPI00196B1AAA|nr:cellulase family glycosylhydrolase [Conexibacter sp. SYSU D00693]
MLRLLPLLLATLVAALLLLAPAGAQAAPTAAVGIADDRIMLFGSDEQAARAVDRWRDLGIDEVRVFARWVAHVPGEDQRTQPADFDATNPDDPQYRWATLDRAVDLVTSRGMDVVLSVTGSGPLWGSLEPQRGNPRWKPDPAKFGQFARAVARRYGPRVDQYVIWNEPNLPLWLQPQSTCKGRSCTPYAPHLYRKLVVAADPAIRAADPGARVLIGALAPRGENARSQNAKLRPLAFLRAMGCVSSRYRRVRSGPCAGFRPAGAYGLAYHPHSMTKGPTTRSANPDDAQLGDLGRLTSALDRISRTGGITVRQPSRKLPLFLTEYGFQTNPPERSGVSLANQSTYLQQAAYMAWQHPRVRALVQYVWQDEPLASGGAGWQSGLLRSDGRAKPALSTFPDPFWAVRLSRTTVRLWGQVRPGTRSQVRLQRRGSTGRWTTIATVQTDARGFYKRDVRISRRASWRAITTQGTSSTRTVR